MPTPDRLRGLAHPVRVRVLAALRSEGPATATGLARRLNLNSGATSYHLRQLAAYGFIVEAGELGNRRDRYWRVPERSPAQPANGDQSTARATPTTAGADPASRAAFLQARLVEHVNAAQAAIEGHSELSAVWSAACALDTHVARLTPAVAQDLVRRIGDLVAEAHEESARVAAEGAEEARPYLVQVQAFVTDAGPAGH